MERLTFTVLGSPILDRIAARLVEDENGCWIWQGGTIKGYGCTSIKQRTVLTHRVVYGAVHGDPGELMVLHRCDVPLCNNPAHLWLGDAGDNQRDAVTKKRHRNSRKTVCKRGHSLTDPANVYLQKGSIRQCRACHALRERERRAAA